MAIVSSANVPVECRPRIAPQKLVFAGIETYSFDFSTDIQTGRIDGIQGIWIDNSASTSALTLAVPYSQQVLDIGAGTRGFYPLMVAPSAPQFSITSAGDATAIIVPYNFAGPCGPIASTTPAYQDGALLVSDAALDAAINGYYIRSQGFALGNNGLIMPRLAGSMQFAGGLSGAATTLTLIPAQAGSAYFLTRLSARLSANATLATAGNLTVTISDGANFNAVLHPYVPATVAGAGDAQIMDEDLQYIAHAQNAALTVTMSAALTAGYLDLVAYGGYTSLTGA